MKERLKSKKGITLVSLVVTIAVLIILASIATYSGVNLIKESKLNKFIAEMKIMQTEVNNLYDRYSSGETSVLGTGEELDSEANNVFTTNASGITDSSGYRYYDRGTIESLGIKEVEEEFYVNVEKRSVISRLGIEYEGKKYYTLEQLPNGLYNVEYENKKNRPEFKATIEQEDNGELKVEVTDIKYDGYINKWEVKYKLEGEDYWRTSEEFEFKVEEFGKYKIKVVNGEIESEEKEIEIKAVAQIGTKKYVTLDRAVKAVENNKETEILMIDNTEEDVTFPDGKKIILNLSDKTITGKQSNYGTLAIKGNGFLEMLDYKINSNQVINNFGILNIYEGTIILKSSEKGGGRAITNQAKAIVNLFGGKIISVNPDSWTFTNYGTLNFKSGEIVLKGSGNGTALITKENGITNMSGGNVSSKSYGIALQENGKFYGKGGKISSTRLTPVMISDNCYAELISMKIIAEDNAIAAISYNGGSYGRVIVKSRDINYGITGKILGKVIATSNTEAGQASENVTIYNTTYQYMLFPTWSEKNGQDDLSSPWPRSYSANRTHTITVKKSEHKNDTGIYNVHIYASNSSYQPQGNAIVGITLTF